MRPGGRWASAPARCGGAFVLVAVAGAALYAAYPLRQPGLPHGTDTLTHLYTLVPLDHLARQGILFSRWAPYRASGFGTPLFNYYAPLAYYAALVFRLFGTSLVTAMRLAFGLSLAGAAAGSYLWARDAFDRLAGVVAAIAYVWAPYMLFNAYVRGGLNEQYALLLMPWTLWAVRRLAATGQARYLTIAAPAYAGLVLAHNLTTLLFSAVLLAYALLLRAAPPPAGRPPAREAQAGPARRRGWLPLAAVGLGLGLSAFFWAPLLLEWDAVLPGLLHQGPEFDYHHNFVPLAGLFQPLLGAGSRPALSPATFGLGVVGLAWLTWRDPARRWEVAFFFLAAAGYALMALPLAAGLWDRFQSVLQYLQFPHRFLSVASLCLAFLAGGGFYALRRSLCRRGKRAGLCSAVLLLGIAILILPPSRVLAGVRVYPPLPDLDVAFVMRKEREAGNIDRTYVVSFIPRDALREEMPPFELLARDGPERLDAASLPPEAAVLSAAYTPLRYTLTLACPVPFFATFNTFYFPGWKARVDGQAVPLAPDAPYGRITVAVPAGQHELVVWFGTTAARLAAGLASLLSLAALVFLCLVIGWRGATHPRKKGE